MVNTENISNRIRKIAANKETVLIAIDGLGGSGKSTLARRLANSLNATIVEMDRFYSEEEMRHNIEQALVNGIIPAKESKGITIVEGVYSMHSNLLDNYDFKIWIECDPKVALERGIRRSGEQERDVWIKIWQPLELEYIEEEKPQEKADIVINTTTEEL